VNDGVSRPNEGFDIVINGVNELFADLEVSAIASASFHKEHYPKDTVQIRRRADGTLLTVLGYARLKQGAAPERKL
jgi:hypothetical protein